MSNLKTTSQILKFIKNYFHRSGRQAAVVGVSGGVDSSTVLTLCAKALGPQRVYPVYIPYQPVTARKTLENVKKVMKLAKIPKKNLLIEDITDQINVFMKKHSGITKIDLGNKIARERMSLLYYHARRLKGLVVGTSNKSESLLGYFTLHGDGAWDIGPIAHLYKTEVKKLARSLGVPREIIDTPPTAGLWRSQTDEGELGFSYEIADSILKKYHDQKLSPSEIEKTGIPKQTISRVLARYRANRFKLQLPGTMRYNSL